MPQLENIKTDKTIIRYFEDLRPDYAQKGGTPNNKPKSECNHKENYINEVIVKYQLSKTE